MIRSRVRRGGAAAACVAVLVAGCASGDRTRGHAHGPEWGAPNADLANTRHLGSAIRSANVARLGVAWTVPLRARYTATPVIVDGIAYTTDVHQNVMAIELHSGEVRWRTDLESLDTGPNGVSVGDGRVFGATPSAAFALDAETGRKLWETPLIGAPGELIVMTPGYHDGIVYVSTNPTAGGNIGTLWAIDARSGRRLWGWEQASRSLWGNPAVNGAGGLWHPPAFDDDGALYISIVDPSPWPGTEEAPWATSRPGPNKWSNSIVKLDARSGRFIWGRQALQHDFYDWDLEGPVILAEAGGRRIALTSGKMGFVYAFDAETGDRLWKRSVGIHNGHDDDSARAMRGDYSNLHYEERIYPGDQGGVETQMASDGQTVYVPVNNLYAIYHGQTIPETQDLTKGTGEMVALDIATGRVRWETRLPHGEYGGATVTNDLVFTTTFEGTIWALDRRTGKIVWKAPLPAGSIAPVGIAGDTVLSAGGIRGDGDQKARLEIVAFRLGAAGPATP